MPNLFSYGQAYCTGRSQARLTWPKILTTPCTCDTLLCHPPATMHFSVLKGVREKQGITEGLVRMSEGIENIKDIITDVEQTL